MDLTLVLPPFLSFLHLGYFSSSFISITSNIFPDCPSAEGTCFSPHRLCFLCGLYIKHIKPSHLHIGLPRRVLTRPDHTPVLTNFTFPQAWKSDTWPVLKMVANVLFFCRLRVSCIYSVSSSALPVNIQVFTLPPPLPETHPGPLTLELQIAKGEALLGGGSGL